MKRLFLGVVFAALLLVLIAPQASAAPSLIGCSAKASYCTLDTFITYGFEIEIMSYVFLQYLTSPTTEYIMAGYRYYLPVDRPYNVTFSVGEAFRINDIDPDFLSAFFIGLDYDPGWWYVGAEVGGGISAVYWRPFFMFQIRAGIHYEW